MFTYNIQLAGYSHDKWDEMGETTFEGFKRTFEEFPWAGQLAIYDKLQEGCSATLSVSAPGERKVLWVSIAGDSNKHSFLIGFVYQKERKGLFGFGKEKTIKWVDIYQAEDKPKIIELFGLFFDQQFHTLQSELVQLKKFDSMKAYIQ